MFTIQKQEMILYSILFIESIKFSTSFQFFLISTKLQVVQAIDDDVGFKTTNIVPVPKLKITTTTNINLFDTDKEHIPVHVLIPSKNTSTSTHYTGTAYNFCEETCNFDEGWKPRTFYSYLEVLGM